MTDQTVETPKIRRGWPKGKKRGPRKPPVAVNPQEVPPPAPAEAPIHVRLRLKNYEKEIAFGCARREVVGGFHVFFYPSEYDRYRETRREFAIAEVIEIEITEARPVYQTSPVSNLVHHTVTPEPPARMLDPVEASQRMGPVVHSAKEWALARQREKLEEQGSRRIDSLPAGITFGDSA